MARKINLILLGAPGATDWSHFGKTVMPSAMEDTAISQSQTISLSLNAVQGRNGFWSPSTRLRAISRSITENCSEHSPICWKAVLGISHRRWMALWIFRLTAYSISKRFPDKIFKIKKIRVNIHTVLRYLHEFFIGINSFKLFSEFIFSFSVTWHRLNNIRLHQVGNEFGSSWAFQLKQFHDSASSKYLIKTKLFKKSVDMNCRFVDILLQVRIIRSDKCIPEIPSMIRKNIIRCRKIEKM